MFGVYQIGANGDPLIASANFHPELLTASQKLANLNQKAIAKLRALEGFQLISLQAFSREIS